MSTKKSFSPLQTPDLQLDIRMSIRWMPIRIWRIIFLLSKRISGNFYDNGLWLCLLCVLSLNLTAQSCRALGRATYFTHSWALYCYSLLCLQTQFYIGTGNLLLVRRYSQEDCSVVCSEATNSSWYQCCSTGDNCNNVPIPNGLTSINDLEKCYAGTTSSECLGIDLLCTVLYYCPVRDTAA